MSPKLLKQIATIAATAFLFFLFGYSYGQRSVPRGEKRWQETIDRCHPFLEAGLPADFGRCVAGGRYNSNP